MISTALVLSVLTLNAAGPRRIHHGWQSRRAELVSQFQRENADVAALQAVWRTDDAAALAAAAGHRWIAHDQTLGLAVTSRRKIIAQTTLSLGDGYGALRASVEAAGTQVDVYSARLVSSDEGGAAQRLSQLFALSEFMRRESINRPLILLGDLSGFAEEPETRLFFDFLDLRDLCVPHGDDICGRTVEDGRVDYTLIPYSPRIPREPARVALASIAEPEPGAPLPTFHFGLFSRLDAGWLKLRLKPAPEGRVDALKVAIHRFEDSAEAVEASAKKLAWIPLYGAYVWRKAESDAARFMESAERARTALIETAAFQGHGARSL